MSDSIEQHRENMRDSITRRDETIAAMSKERDDLQQIVNRLFASKDAQAKEIERLTSQLGSMHDLEDELRGVMDAQRQEIERLSTQYVELGFTLIDGLPESMFSEESLPRGIKLTASKLVELIIKQLDTLRTERDELREFARMVSRQPFSSDELCITARALVERTGGE